MTLISTLRQIGHAAHVVIDRVTHPGHHASGVPLEQHATPRAAPFVRPEAGSKSAAASAGADAAGAAEATSMHAEGVAKANRDLARAAFQSNESLLISALQRGAAINSAGADGRTALHHAAVAPATRDSQGFQLALLKGFDQRGARADLAAVDAQGNTPVHLAARQGSLRFLNNATVTVVGDHTRRIDMASQNHAGQTPADLAPDSNTYAELMRLSRAFETGQANDRPGNAALLDKFKRRTQVPQLLVNDAEVNADQRYKPISAAQSRREARKQSRMAPDRDMDLLRVPKRR